MEDKFKNLESITIKLIERHNQTDKTLAEVSERLARLEKQTEDNYLYHAGGNRRGK